MMQKMCPLRNDCVGVASTEWLDWEPGASQSFLQKLVKLGDAWDQPTE